MSPSNTAVPDHLVLTAANEAQAEGYRLQLDLRREVGLLPAAMTTHVVVDLDGRRLGSGGSTLLVLKHLAETLEPRASLCDVFAGKRVFLLHAGGDCKRLPAYAAEGKIFTPLPCGRATGGCTPTLFDLLFANLCILTRPPGGHLLVAAGDVLLTFDPREVDCSRPGLTGVACVEQADRASRHGVYVAGAAGEVLDFLQKPTDEEMRRRGALDGLGRALLDTGLMSLDPAAVERLCAAAGLSYQDGTVSIGPGLLAAILSGKAAEVDLYEEVALALPPRIAATDYEARVLARPRNADPGQQVRLRAFRDALHGLPFHVAALSHCDFFHIGTSRELLAGVAGRNRTGSHYAFGHGTRAVMPPRIGDTGAFVFNSVLEAAAYPFGPTTLIEGSHVRAVLELAGRNVVTGLPAAVTQRVRLPEGVGLLYLPLLGGAWAPVLYGIDDDFGQPAIAGAGTFLNEPLGDFLRRHELPAAALWPGEPSSVYHAQLWCTGTADETLRQIHWMLTAQANPEAVAEWQAARRFSLAELLRQVDQPRRARRRADLLRTWTIHNPFARLAAEPDLDAAQLVRQVGSRAEAAAVLADLANGTAGAVTPELLARCRVVAMLLRRRLDELAADPKTEPVIDAACRALSGGDATAAALGRSASAAVAASIALTVLLPDREPRAAIEHDHVVWATAPARLDFMGGWTDTPPVCNDLGGTVVNAAVKLNGQYPFQAVVKLNADHVINLTSIDLGRRVCFDRIEQLLDYADPGDWNSLPKACLCLAGLTAGRTAGDLRPFLERFGGGIDLTVFSALPKGSGLGGSSILGATILAALARLQGESLTQDQLVARTSLLEQRLTTGGGWQDQVGAVFPGVKYIHTEPGPRQSPAISWLAFHEAGARGRLLLYYTGLKRLAKNILQNVVHRYLARDPEVLRALAQLQAGAQEMRLAIETRDLDGFGAGLRRYGELKKQIDPTATNAAIEQLIARVEPLSSGHVLPGAGGGGFLLILARDEDAARRLRADLTARPSHPGARFFDFRIDEQGLDVSVL